MTDVYDNRLNVAAQSAELSARRARGLTVWAQQISKIPNPEFMFSGPNMKLYYESIGRDSAAATVVSRQKVRKCEYHLDMIQANITENEQNIALLSSKIIWS